MNHQDPNPERPLLLTIDDVAAGLNFSIRAVWRLDSTGVMPAPVHVTGTRWIRQEIEAWVADGCPDLTDDRLRYRRRRAS